MIYHSTYFDDYLSYLILRAKQKKYNTPEDKVSPLFQLSEQLSCYSQRQLQN